MNDNSSVTNIHTEPLNILHITYDMRIGGTEMVIKNIIDGCDKTKFVMSVLCIESPLGPFAKDLINDGIPFYELNRQPGFDKKLIANIRKTIQQNNIDILHCHQYTPWVYGVISAALTKTKVIFTEHGRFYPDSSTWKRKLINPILNLFTDKITVISKATKLALNEFENIPTKDIDVIYNGIAPLHFDKNKATKLRATLNIPNNHIVLGTVARFDPIKNHTMMLEAFTKVLKVIPNCTLLMVGDGEERANIEQCITKLGITKNVILAGYEPKPAEHIALMDTFLLSSLSEGTSMTLLEAMSIGKPCVVTDAGGNPEIIQNNENGFVTQNDNACQFAEKIILLINNPELTRKYAISALSIYQKNFALSLMSHKYTQVYKAI